MNTLHFTGTDFVVHGSELDSTLLQDLIDCGAGGQDAQPAVDYVLDTYEISGDAETCADYLREYGAWDNDELSDHDTNLQRLVWLAGCDLRESNEIYFCTY